MCEWLVCRVGPIWNHLGWETGCADLTGDTRRPRESEPRSSSFEHYDTFVENAVVFILVLFSTLDYLAKVSSEINTRYCCDCFELCIVPVHQCEASNFGTLAGVCRAPCKIDIARFCTVNHTTCHAGRAFKVLVSFV